MKKLMTVAMIVSTVLVVGCSGDNATSENQGKAERQKPKTVVVNKGMSKKEEEKLNQRIEELEEEVNDESSKQPEQDTESAEDSARAAAEDYYAAAADGNYAYTYSKLSSSSQSQISEDEWIADNIVLGSDEAIYDIDSVEMVDDATANVYLTITTADGSGFERFTQFVLEDGSWIHDLTQEEYELFAETTSASASASDSASANASTNADTKHVKIVISSNKPADVIINDDSLNWFVTEEITGTETYERDIAENSGLSVSATTDAYSAQTTIEVYENGSLVAQDSDSSGYATVNY